MEKQRGCDTIVLLFLSTSQGPQGCSSPGVEHVTQEDWVLSSTRDPDPGTGAQVGKGCWE